MDCQGDEIARKRKKSAMEDSGGPVGEGVVCNVVANEETETNIGGSMYQAGSDLLEAIYFEFEDRLNMFHKEQMDKLQDVIKGLRPLDSSNEDDNTLLHIARCLLQNPHTSSSEVYELLKSLYKELFNDIEDQLIMLHKENMDIWQDGMKKLRPLDSSNEDDDNLLLQNPRTGSSEGLLGDE